MQWGCLDNDEYFVTMCFFFFWKWYLMVIRDFTKDHSCSLMTGDTPLVSPQFPGVPFSSLGNATFASVWKHGNDTASLVFWIQKEVGNDLGFFFSPAVIEQGWMLPRRAGRIYTFGLEKSPALCQPKDTDNTILNRVTRLRVHCLQWTWRG